MLPYKLEAEPLVYDKVENTADIAIELSLLAPLLLLLLWTLGTMRANLIINTDECMSYFNVLLYLSNITCCG